MRIISFLALTVVMGSISFCLQLETASPAVTGESNSVRAVTVSSEKQCTSRLLDTGASADPSANPHTPTPTPPESERVETRWALVRAYTPWDPIDKDSPWRDGLTSTLRDTNTFPHHWGIAADPQVLPYGTEIYVPGYDPSKHFPERTFWEVDDTGALVRQAHRRGVRDRGKWYPPGTTMIELRFIHQRSAMNWGSRWMKIYIRKHRE